MKYREVIIKTEISKCFLCADAPCSIACTKGVAVDKIIRSLVFDNEAGARFMLKNNPCAECKEKSCMKACNGAKVCNAVDFAKIAEALGKHCAESTPDKDISTDLYGVKCENPFFLSSSVVGSNYDMVAKAFDAGWAGVAFKTIGMFVPDEVSPRFDCFDKNSNSFSGFKNLEQISTHTLEENLNCFKKLKKNYPGKVIIASIMGRSEDEWTTLATLCEQAGADVIECNFSCPQMALDGVGSDVGTDTELVYRYTKAVKNGTRLPVLAKMTPNITSMLPPAISAADAGADGIAAINTIKSILNVDLDTFSTSPSVNGKS